MSPLVPVWDIDRLPSPTAANYTHSGQHVKERVVFFPRLSISVIKTYSRAETIPPVVTYQRKKISTLKNH